MPDASVNVTFSRRSVSQTIKYGYLDQSAAPSPIRIAHFRFLLLLPVEGSELSANVVSANFFGALGKPLIAGQTYPNLDSRPGPRGSHHQSSAVRQLFMVLGLFAPMARAFCFCHYMTRAVKLYLINVDGTGLIQLTHDGSEMSFHADSRTAGELFSRISSLRILVLITS
jgi:hypothetical protein